MAKRKRLSPANPVFLPGDAPPETGSNPARAPIAGVAGEAASQAALQELSDTLARARDEGRMVLSLPLSAIDLGHLVRDRMEHHTAADDSEMAALKASIAARGQQTPIEVTDLGEGRYGLISGWRRCRALAQLAEETGEARFSEVLALLRRPADSCDAYLAMVEENEIRTGLSFFERARIVQKAVDQGVFETHKAALLELFRAGSRAKRSKIRSFLPVVAALDGVLRHPQAIGERLGLQISKRLEADPGLAKRLHGALGGVEDDGPEAERDALISTLKRGLGSKTPPKPPKYSDREIRNGLTVRQHSGGGRIEILGVAADADLHARLLDWLERRE